MMMEMAVLVLLMLMMLLLMLMTQLWDCVGVPAPFHNKQTRRRCSYVTLASGSHHIICKKI